MRWLHTYISMAGLGALLFFSITGLTLNHPDWNLGQRRQEFHLKGQLDPKGLATGGQESAVDRLAIVESLRRAHGIPGLVDDFRIDDAECSVAFKGPGSSADALIQRRTGSYELTLTREGFLPLINDLHKGRHTGTVWAWIIDLTAVVLALVAVSGLWLLFYVRRRRNTGLWIGLAGAAVLWILYWIGVK